MTSVAAHPVAPWKARLPWVMLALTIVCVAVLVPLSLGLVSLWLRGQEARP